MPAWLIPAALAGASALGGWLKNKTTQTQTTTPTLDPALGGLQGQLLAILRQRMAGSGGQNLAGLTNRRIAGVNQAYRGASTALQNKLRAAGLATSGVAGGAEAGLEEARAGDIGGLIAEEPLLQQQQQDATFQQALSLLGQGRGSSSTGGVQGGGGGLGGALTDVGGILGFLYGNGMLGGGGKPKLGPQPAGVRI